MSVVSLVADATTALGSDVVALAFDAEPPDQAAAAMEIALAAAADPSDLVRILVDAFGRAGLRRVLATLAVPIASGVDAETLATAWLEHRGLTRARPRARPQRLAADLRVQIAQARTNEALYGTAKTITPELERLVRWVAWFYLAGAGDEAARLARCREVFARCFSKERAPVLAATLADTLERAPLGVVATLLAEIGDTPRRPYALTGSEPVRVMTADERTTLQETASGRNPILHGRDDGEAGESLCARISALLDGWSARGVIPRGAVVRGVDHRVGSVAVVCVTEDGRREALLGLRRAPADRGTVAVEGRPTDDHVVAPLLEAWPEGPAWEDPIDLR